MPTLSLDVHRSAALLLAVFLAACAPEGDTGDAAGDTAVARSGDAASVTANPTKDVYFGNFHVHTMNSFDAFTNGAVTGPDDAYRWAKGEAIPGGGGGPDLQIRVPLDWYIVSDHAEYLGVFPMLGDPDSPLSQLEIARRVNSDDDAVAFQAFAELLQGISAGTPDEDLIDPTVSRSIWQDVIETADSHYEPGRFTTFAGFEWTSNPDQRNLHRVVFFKDTEGLPDLPFSVFDSDRPEDLWAWMDGIRDGGVSLLAIPHNGNASDGLMFPEGTTYGGSAMTRELAETRMRNEPLYEITQIKGTSEAHPDLSPNDEFASFELWDYTLAPDAPPPTNRVGSYVRDAFKRGIAAQARGEGNPFKYGLIGDSDTHNSASTIEEDNYTGKFAFENSAEHRVNGPPDFSEASKTQVRLFSSGGVAGIWAESNTRDGLYASIRAKETFATSGPRMKVRFFGGVGLDEVGVGSDGWLQRAYADGVPMGGDLVATPGGEAPVFLVHAMKEADGANLDRIQVIKGWVDAGGATHERIYDVALSDGRAVDAQGNVPPVGNTVDAPTASYTNEIGDAELTATWTDPDFDPELHAFYYVRVLQIPTPRWSTYDAATIGQPPRDDLPVAIQERAWSSPIWYTP